MIVNPPLTEPVPMMGYALLNPSIRLTVRPMKATTQVAIDLLKADLEDWGPQKDADWKLQVEAAILVLTNIQSGDWQINENSADPDDDLGELDLSKACTIHDEGCTSCQ